MLSLTQIYLRAEPDADQAESRAREILDDLRGDPTLDYRAVGDPFLHPAVFRDISQQQLSGVFGSNFRSDRASEVPAGGGSMQRTSCRWCEPGRPSELAEVRDAVYRDLVGERTRETEKHYFEGLLSQYTVTAEWPEGMEPVAIPGVIP